MLQVEQIVFTATTFPDVQDVQLLIDERKEMELGDTELYIAAKMGRNMFRKSFKETD